MSILLRVAVTPRRVELAPGDSATVEVRIVNTSPVVARYAVTVVGPAAAWSTVEPPELEEGVMPDKEATVTVTLAPPAEHPPQAGLLVIGIMVRAIKANPEASWVEELEVRVVPVPKATLTLKPEVRRAAGAVSYDALVGNQGNVPLQLRLWGEDQERTVRFRFSPRIIDLPGDRSAVAKVRVSAPQRWTGPDTSRVLTVHADGVPEPLTATAIFVQRSRLAGGLLRAVGLAGIAALIAGSILASNLIGGDSEGSTGVMTNADGGGSTTVTAVTTTTPSETSATVPETSATVPETSATVPETSATVPETSATEPETSNGGGGPGGVGPAVISFDKLLDGSAVTEDRFLDRDDFAAKGIRLRGAPESDYCADGTTAAVRKSGTYGFPFPFLTTSAQGEIDRCNTVPVEITFDDPVRKVTLVFSGASVTYDLKVFNREGKLLTSVPQAAQFGGEPVEVSHAEAGADIATVTFGHQTAVTAVKELRYER